MADTVKNPKLDGKSADEIEAMLIEMNNDLAERRAAILEVHRVYDEKRNAEDALKKLDTLNDREIEALVQHVQQHGIPSRSEAEAKA